MKFLFKNAETLSIYRGHQGSKKYNNLPTVAKDKSVREVGRQQRCPKHQPPWPLPTLGHGSFPHLSTWRPSTDTPAKWTSQQIQGPLFSSVLQSTRMCNFLSCQRHNSILFCLTKSNTFLQRTTLQSRAFSKNPGINLSHESGNSGQVTGYQVVTCL